MDEVPSEAVIIVDNEDHGRRPSGFNPMVEEALLRKQLCQFVLPEFGPTMRSMALCLFRRRDEDELCRCHPFYRNFRDAIVRRVDEIISRVNP